MKNPLLLSLVLLAEWARIATVQMHDVVVYGGTPGGIVAAVALAKNPAAAKAKIAKAGRYVAERQRDTMGVLRRELAR